MPEILAFSFKFSGITKLFARMNYLSLQQVFII